MASLPSALFSSALLPVLFLFTLSPFVSGAFVGVNYGTDGDNLPTPQQVVDFTKKQGISQIRIFDTNGAILQAFAGSNIEIIVGIPNEEILSVGQSNATAANWVKKNIAVYLPSTNITGIAVGSEVLTDYTIVASVLVPTMTYIHAALVAANLDSQIKVSTPHATSLILDSFPPSEAFFNQTYSKSVIQPMLDFLSETSSYFMLNIYPLTIYQQNHQVMSIDFSLFRPNTGAQDSNTNLLYSNVFDAILDAAFSAMGALNHTDVPIVVTETGWPSRGDMNEMGVSIENAETYINNLIKHVLNNTGTPQKPGISVNTYIYELFNEDRREGATSEKNYGLFYPDMTPVYAVDITGTGAYNTNGTANRTWCVAKPGASDSSLQAALDFACGQGHADCSAIQTGQSCFNPDTVKSHASYAFNSYYQKAGMSPGSCDFRGVAMITPTDPSYGQCIYPSSQQTNQTAGNTTNSAVGLSPAGFITLMSVSLIMLLY